MATSNSLDNMSSPFRVGGSFWTTGGVNTNSSQPSFFAYLSATQSNVTGNGATYQIIFDTVLLDKAANYDNTTGTFTASVTGLYAISYKMVYSNATSLMIIGASSLSIPPTASVYSFNAFVAQDGNAFGTVTQTGYFPLTSGDTVSVTVNILGGVANDVDIAGDGTGYLTYFCAALLN